MNDQAELWRKLIRAGLQPLRFAEEPELPAPLQVWRSFASSQPETVFDDPDDTEFTRYGELGEAWVAAARKSSVVDTNGEFLVSVEGSGGGVPWVLVRMTDRFSVEHLGEYPGHPSFIAMDRAGTRLCGIDTEEHEFWIVVAPA